MKNLEYLDVGTIWKSKKLGNLTLVLALANFELPKKYQLTNPPSVVFTDGNRIFSSPVDRFLELRTFVRLDKALHNNILNCLASPITEEPEEPMLGIYDDASVNDDDDDDDLVIADSQDDAAADTNMLVSKAHENSTKSQSVLTASNIEASNIKKFITIKKHGTSSDFEDIFNQSFHSYNQFRSDDGVYYHTLSFTSSKPVQILYNDIENIDYIAIENIGVNFSSDDMVLVNTWVSIANTSSGILYFYNAEFADYSDKVSTEAEPNLSEVTEVSASAESVEPDKVAESKSEDVDNLETFTHPFETALAESAVTSAKNDESDTVTAQSENNDSASFEELEDVSINAVDSENKDDADNLEDADEIIEKGNSTDNHLETVNAEEVDEETAVSMLKQNTFLASTADVEDIDIDSVSESLALKLDAVIKNESESDTASKDIEQAAFAGLNRIIEKSDKVLDKKLDKELDTKSTGDE